MPDPLPRPRGLTEGEEPGAKEGEARTYQLPGRSFVVPYPMIGS